MASDEEYKQLHKFNEQLITVMGSLVETRNLESRGHIKRMRAFTHILATDLKDHYPEYGIDDATVLRMVAASALHDMGKIMIPDSILFKPARLTREEFEVMKTHTTLGCELLDKIIGAWDADYHKMAYEICRSHHEKYDGKGYPDGLVGDEIPISAQIVSIADIFDALVCVKLYKDAYTPEQAYRMIISGECGVFNPKLMECFKRCADQFELVARKSREDEARWE